MHSRRRPVHKGKSARHFKHQVKRTHIKNVIAPPRGGFRL